VVGIGLAPRKKRAVDGGRLDETPPTALNTRPEELGRACVNARTVWQGERPFLRPRGCDTTPLMPVLKAVSLMRQRS
jgi:hypothetical protein